MLGHSQGPATLQQLREGCISGLQTLWGCGSCRGPAVVCMHVVLLKGHLASAGWRCGALSAKVRLPGDTSACKRLCQHSSEAVVPRTLPLPHIPSEQELQL